ncbi:MAG: type II toxin-antitoxin system VapC family toxin, partial [Planctomycetes bacterium]|nr:type II toxin-antitoxin system VapC family toxin [Planctomycetota bacterium]
MSKYLLDTNIISSYLRGDETLKEKISGNIDLIATSIISYYEIISGLLSINANKRINEFEAFCEIVEIVNLDKSSIKASCQIYSDLKNSGNLVDDIDILIAGI